MEYLKIKLILIVALILIQLVTDLSITIIKNYDHLNPKIQLATDVITGEFNLGPQTYQLHDGQN